MILCAVIVLLLINISLVCGHGYLIDPPGRASAWRKGFKTPPNYNDMSQICRGECSPCGPARSNTDGNTIVARYSPGQQITAIVKITANHLGPFFFKLCPNANSVSESCFNQHPVEVVGSRDRYRYDIPKGGSNEFRVQLKLPAGIQCDRCVLQWHWDARNTGEKYRNCADISIGSGGGNGGGGGGGSDGGNNGGNRGNGGRKTNGGGAVGPPPVRGNCRSLTRQANDHWCQANCSRGFCPPTFCRCN